jgi:hypothetical protein
MKTPADEAIEMISTMLKKGRGGVKGGRACVTIYTDEPLVESAGGEIEGRATTVTGDVVVTEPLMEVTGGVMEGRATIEDVVVTEWP